MRYILETLADEGSIGSQIKRWADDKKIEIIEKAEPALEIKAQLERAARALEVLKKAGLNSEVLKVWLRVKTQMGASHIQAFLESQDAFFRAIGLVK